MWRSVFLMLLSSASLAATDPETGLEIAPGYELVRAHCVVCHSSRLVTQAGLSRERWKASIRYMQQNHNLWPLGNQEDVILDYLAANYGPGKEVAESPGKEAVKRRKKLPYF